MLADLATPPVTLTLEADLAAASTLGSDVQEKKTCLLLSTAAQRLECLKAS